MKKILISSILIVSLGAIAGYGDTLRLRNGGAMQGTLRVRGRCSSCRRAGLRFCPPFQLSGHVNLAV